MQTRPDDRPERPPLGSWPRTYALACVLAVLTILLLWWFSAAFAPARFGR